MAKKGYLSFNKSRLSSLFEIGNETYQGTLACHILHVSYVMVLTASNVPRIVSQLLSGGEIK